MDLMLPLGEREKEALHWVIFFLVAAKLPDCLKGGIAYI
jgi:hypothetical protein